MFTIYPPDTKPKNYYVYIYKDGSSPVFRANANKNFADMGEV